MAVGSAFNGSTSFIELGVNNYASWSGFTHVALVYVNSLSGVNAIFHNDGSGSYSGFSIRTSGEVQCHAAGSEARRLTSPTIPTGAWRLIVCTKASGTAVVRLHVYDGSSWSHNNFDGPATGQLPDIPTDVTNFELGRYDSFTSANMEIGFAGLWNGDTASDGTVETFLDYTVLAAKANRQFFPGATLLSAGTVNDTSSINNDETSRTAVSAGSQTLPAWFTNYPPSEAAVTLAAFTSTAIGGVVNSPAYVKEVGFVTNTSAGTTSTITVAAGGVPVGDTIVVYGACDNTGASGAATTIAVADNSNNSGTANTYTLQSPQAIADPVGASAGSQGFFVVCPVTRSLDAGDTITITYGNSTAAKAINAQQFSGVNTTTPVLASSYARQDNQTAQSVSVAAGANPTTAGQIVCTLVSVEGGTADAFTQDTDTTNGSWVTLTRRGSGTTTSGITLNSAYKIVTASGAQTYNHATMLGTSRDHCAAILVLDGAPVLRQAAYRFYADGTETGSTALAAQDTAYDADISGGDVNLAVRVRLQNANLFPVPSTDDFRLQYEKNTSGTWVDVAPVLTLADGFDDPSPDTWLDFGDTSTSRLQVGNSFTGNGGNLTKATFWFAKRGSPTSDVEARIYAHTGTYGSGGTPTGAVLATSTPIPAASISTTAGTVEFDFDGSFTLVAATNYFVTLSCSLSGGASDGYRRYALGGSGNHAGNQAIFVASWAASAGADSLFAIYTGGSTRSVYSYDSASLTEAEATTNRLGSGTGSFVAGKASEDGLIDNLGWTAANYTELLYSITLNSADLADDDDLLFRVVRNGSADLIYTATPTLTVSSGAPPVTGTSAQTLDPFTSTATGSVVNPVTGTSAQTLAAFTSTASGTETITGSSAQTLAAFTSTASGAETISGSSAQTLAAFTSTATAVETFTGTSAQTLAAFTSTATGAVVNPITGTSAQTLDAFTSTASGTHTVNITGTSAQTLAAFTSTATAVETISGTSAQTLAAFTSTASGSVAPAVTGTSAQTFADFTSTASGTVTAPGVSGSAAVTLAAFTSTAAGVETITGTSAQTLAGHTSTAAGVVAQPVTGTAAVALANHTSTASGLTQQNITGTSAVTLANHTSTAAGVETFTGTSAQTLAAFTSTATGLETISGTSAQTLAAFTSTASGIETITGTVATTLANHTSTASGLTQQNITGTAAVTLAGHTSTAAGTVTAPITGTAATTLTGHTSTATGAVINPITGTVAVTLTGHISTAAGVETFTGSSAQTLAAFTSTATGIVLTPIVGTAAVTLQDFFTTTTAAPIVATYGPLIRAARPAMIQRTRPVTVTMRRPDDLDLDRPAILELARPGV